MSLPSKQVLESLLEYNPLTGVLIWKPRGDIAWDARFAGKPALTCMTKHGYLYGTLYGVRVQTHRVIFKLVYGTEPESIDHEDHDPSNNRIKNLHESDALRNQKNRSHAANNKSGTTGVCWHKATGKWHAQIGVKGKRVSLGHFDIIEDAIAARKAAEIDHNYHQNHGRK